MHRLWIRSAAPGTIRISWCTRRRYTPGIVARTTNRERLHVSDRDPGCCCCLSSGVYWRSRRSQSPPVPSRRARSERFAAVEIRRGSGACQAARALDGQRFLANHPRHCPLPVARKSAATATSRSFRTDARTTAVGDTTGSAQRCSIQRNAGKLADPGVRLTNSPHLPRPSSLFGILVSSACASAALLRRQVEQGGADARKTHDQASPELARRSNWPCRSHSGRRSRRRGPITRARSVVPPGHRCDAPKSPGG